MPGCGRNTPGSKAIMTGSILGFSLPNFWVGLMLIMVFAVLLPDLIPGWPRLPASGRGATVDVLGVKLSFLTARRPAATCCCRRSRSLLYKGALIVRLARATAREVLPMDYVKFARAKGLSESRIVGVHVLKNIMIPIATVSGLEFGQTVAFAVVTETVFSWPGVGKLLIDSILLLDRPVVVAYLVIIVFFFVAAEPGGRSPLLGARPAGPPRKPRDMTDAALEPVAAAPAADAVPPRRLRLLREPARGVRPRAGRAVGLRRRCSPR